MMPNFRFDGGEQFEFFYIFKICIIYNFIYPKTTLNIELL